ncbi:protein TOPAZ1 isoform X3 [Acipenser ruthenus]|uniref:protein TOPAZ1 isoform X3 n=1 Tax=Acipenser ruthenus TaxID=7906 RepID=UPI00274214A2|nr:protein TOPAZ1 isoform X3 [Acipenser ruthenus]
MEGRGSSRQTRSQIRDMAGGENEIVSGVMTRSGKVALMVQCKYKARRSSVVLRNGRFKKKQLKKTCSEKRKSDQQSSRPALEVSLVKPKRGSPRKTASSSQQLQIITRTKGKSIKSESQSSTDMKDAPRRGHPRRISLDQKLINAESGDQCVGDRESRGKDQRGTARRRRRGRLSYRQRRIPKNTVTNLGEKRPNSFSVFVAMAPGGREVDVLRKSSRVTRIVKLETQLAEKGIFQREVGQGGKSHKSSSECFSQTRKEKTAVNRTCTVAHRKSTVEKRAGLTLRSSLQHQESVSFSSEMLSLDKRVIRNTCCQTCSEAKYVNLRPTKDPCLKTETKANDVRIKRKTCISQQGTVRKLSGKNNFEGEKYPIVKLYDIAKRSGTLFYNCSCNCDWFAAAMGNTNKVIRKRDLEFTDALTCVGSSAGTIDSVAQDSASISQNSNSSAFQETADFFPSCAEKCSGPDQGRRHLLKRLKLSCELSDVPDKAVAAENEEKIDTERENGTSKKMEPIFGKELSPLSECKLVPSKILESCNDVADVLRLLDKRERVNNCDSRSEDLQGSQHGDGFSNAESSYACIKEKSDTVYHTPQSESCTIEEILDVDTGDSFGSESELFSCQRTTPYSGCIPVSCARTCLTWPLQKCVFSAVMPDSQTAIVTISPTSGPSTHNEPPGQPLSSSLSVKPNQTMDNKINDSASIVSGLSGAQGYSTKCQFTLQQEDGAKYSQISKPVEATSYVCPCTATIDSVGEVPSTFSMAPVEQEQTNYICSPSPYSLTHISKESDLYNCNLSNSLNFSVDDFLESLKKPKSQSFTIPLISNKCNGPAQLEGCQTYNPPDVNSAASQVGPLKKKPLVPNSSCSGTPSASQVLGVMNSDASGKEECDSDLTNAWSEEEDGLADLCCEYSGAIMCEINDVCSSSRTLKGNFQDSCAPCNENICNDASKTGSVEDVMDVVKAYEQDAIVLDVILDDPDLFGSPSEVIKPIQISRGADSKIQEVSKDNPVKAAQNLGTSGHCISRKRVGQGLKNISIPFQRNRSLLVKDEKRSLMPDGDSSIAHSTEWSVEGPFSGLDGFQMDNSVKEQKVPLLSVPGPVPMDLDTESQDPVVFENCASKVGTGQWNESDLSERSYSDHKMANPGTRLPGTPDKMSKFSPDISNFKCAVKHDSPESCKWWNNPRPNTSFNEPVEQTELPPGYCKFYFNTNRGCVRNICWFQHVPNKGDEKFCMRIVQKFLKTSNPSFLQRAVTVFTTYYRISPPGVHFNSEVMTRLLYRLLNESQMKEVFTVLQIVVLVKMLPPSDLLLQVFQRVTLLGLRKAVPSLIDVTCKCVDAGLELTVENFNYMQRQLDLLQAPREEIDVFLAVKSRLLEKQATRNEQFDLDVAVAEVEHCKEQQDWAKLGTIFINVCLGYRNLGELNRFCSCIASSLIKDVKETPMIPFREFAEKVCQEPHVSGLDKSLLGRIGISVLFGYYKAQHWTKGRRLLDTLHGMKIHFSTLKGLLGNDCYASRCQILNIAAEIYLNSGNLEKAVSVLKESDWIISTPVWPCDNMDVLNRHNLLCRMAEESAIKNLHREALEVLKKLPGLQNFSDNVDVSRYTMIFNRHLSACIENQNLAVSSNTVDFMTSKSIPVDFSLLRKLIFKLGKNSLWLKARSLYKKKLCTLEGCIQLDMRLGGCRIRIRFTKS